MARRIRRIGRSLMIGGVKFFLRSLRRNLDDVSDDELVARIRQLERIVRPFLTVETTAPQRTET